jgi:hypothetical protein
VSYHGISGYDRSGSWQGFRIFVESTEWGPTERKSFAKRLGELQSHLTGLGFGWGYNGGGTSATADAILRSAMGEEPSEDLREDFCIDVVAHLADVFYLRQGMVLRWALGWHMQRGEELPPALQSMPPLR